MTVYFARASGTDHLKIGFTDGDVNDRLRQLQTGCPNRLVLEDALEGDFKTESFIHEELKAFRHEKGEWFRLTPEQVRAFIDSQPRLVRKGFAVSFLEYISEGPYSMTALRLDMESHQNLKEVFWRIRNTHQFSSVHCAKVFGSLPRLLAHVRAEGVLADSATLINFAEKYLEYVVQADMSPGIRRAAFCYLQEAYASFEEHAASHKAASLKKYAAFGV